MFQMYICRRNDRNGIQLCLLQHFRVIGIDLRGLPFAAHLIQLCLCPGADCRQLSIGNAEH